MTDKDNSLKIIAEIGVNHEGDIQKALELTSLAAQAGADIIKYQSYSPERFIAAHDEQRFARVTKFALSKENHLALYKLTQSLNVDFMSTPVTEDWVEFLNPLCSAFKIASGDITFEPVIKKAVHTGKPLIISTGAATLDEIDQAVKWVSEVVEVDQLKEKLTLMHCVSAYPAPIEEANILSIPFLREKYGLNIGYSNHVMGMNACLAAVALGANVIEVHFTDQKEGREFRDHSLSFDQKDLREFVQRAREIKKSLGAFGKEPQSCEIANISAMRKGIIASKDLKKGQILTEDDVMFARPATEFKAGEISMIIGKTIKRDIAKGYLIPRDSI